MKKYIFTLLFFLLVFPTQSLAVETTNLVSYWKLDEESGTRIDSHDSNDLTDNNTVGFTTGILNNSAQQVASSNEHLSIVSNSSLNFGTGNFSVSFWIKTTATAGLSVISKHTNAGNAPGWNFHLNSYSAGKLAFTIQESSDNEPHQARAISTTSVNDGNWYHIVGVRDADTIYLYVNGSLEDSATSSGSPNVNNSADLSTSRASATGYYVGIIDEIGIWSSNLTSTEVSELYNTGDGLAYPFDGSGETSPEETISTSTIQFLFWGDHKISDINPLYFFIGLLVISFPVIVILYILWLIWKLLMFLWKVKP